MACALGAGVALAGILVLLHASLDMKALIAGKHATLLYALTPAMRPRMLLTLDSEGQLLPVPVRVGQAVDVVAQVRDFIHPIMRAMVSCSVACSWHLLASWHAGKRFCLA